MQIVNDLLWSLHRQTTNVTNIKLIYFNIRLTTTNITTTDVRHYKFQITDPLGHAK